MALERRFPSDGCQCAREKVGSSTLQCASAATIQFGDFLVSFSPNPVFPPGSTTMTIATDGIVRALLGLNAMSLDVDVNTDTREDAADIVTNERALE